ncbi:MAG TPA: thioredoxin [Bacteroidales bacterium]
MNYYFWVPMGILFILLIFAFYKRTKMLRSLMSQKESDKLRKLTDANFQGTINKGITLVDFWAPWCTPCKIQGPIVSDVAEEIGDKAKICKLNVDENQKTAAKYGIRSIPTIYIFKDGEPVKKFVGVKTKTVLVKAINEIG